MKRRRKTKTKLSEPNVKKLRPPKAGKYPYIRYDTEIPGFGVRVAYSPDKPEGAKTFVLNYSLRNVERRYIIGKLGVHSATSAKTKARELRRLIDAGGDPIEHEKRKQEALDKEERSQHTMKELADAYLADASPKKRDSTNRNDESMIETIIGPRLGSMKVSAVTQRDVELLHQSMKDRPYRANRVLYLLSAMFTYAIGREWATKNVARVKSKKFPGIEKYPEEMRITYLTAEQLAQMEKALKRYEHEHPGQDAANAIRLLIETGSRCNEVLSSRWEQFDLKGGIWTKPKEMMKGKSAVQVPLSNAALKVLKRMDAKKTSAFLFPGRAPGKLGYSGKYDTGKARVTIHRAWVAVCRSAGLAKEVKIPGKKGHVLSRWIPWEPRKNKRLRPHDLRHTFVSQLVNSSVSLALIGSLVGHRQPSTTQRYAHVNDAAPRAAANVFGNRKFGKAS